MFFFFFFSYFGVVEVSWDIAILGTNVNNIIKNKI